MKTRTVPLYTPINDGWRLGTIKDNSDNTAVLGVIEKLAGGIFKMSGFSEGSGCNNPGLYRVAIVDGK